MLRILVPDCRSTVRLTSRAASLNRAGLPSGLRVRPVLSNYGGMLKDFLWTGGADGLILVASLVSFIILGRRLGPEDYGAYLGTFGVITPLGAVTFGGFGLAVMQRHLRDGESVSSATRSYLTLVMIIGPVGVVIAAVVGSLVIDRLDAVTIGLLAYVELIAFSVTWIIAAATQAAVSVGAAARLRMLAPVVRVTTLLGLWATDNVTVRNAAAAWAVTFSLLALGFMRFQLPRIGVRFRLARPTKPVVTTGAQLSLPTLATSLQNDTDKAVLNANGLAFDAGLYGAAFRVIMMARLPLRSLNGALFHRFLTHDATASGQHLRRARSYSLVSLPMSIALAAGVWVMAPYFDFLVGDDFDGSVTIIRWLTLFLPLRSLSQAPLNGLLGLGRMGARLIALITASIASMVMYISDGRLTSER
jgi:O-antigen/teichoic acid export membrane protein